MAGISMCTLTYLVNSMSHLLQFLSISAHEGQSTSFPWILLVCNNKKVNKWVKKIVNKYST